MPLDEELIVGLKQAKTQPRHFAIVAKGTSTVHAIVRRKAIKDGELLKAKTEYKGNATYQGVVQFDGEAYVFSFTEDPGLGLVKLRTYLIEQTGLNLKVACQVVPALPGVPDGEEESGESQSTSSSVPPPPPPPDDRKNRLVETLKKLTAAAQQAIAIAADRKSELLTGLGDAKTAISDGQFDQAAARLKAVNDAIQGILAGGDEEDEVELEEDALLESLFPDDPDEQEEDEAEAETTGSGPTEGSIGGDSTGDAPVPPPTPVPPTAKSPGVGGRLQWERVKEEVAERLSQLQSHLRQQNDPGLKRIGEVGFHSITGQLQVGLRVALMEFDRAAKNEDREKFRKKALEIIGKYQEFIKTNQLLKKCDENPFGIKLDARNSLRTALDALAASLKS